MINKKFVTVGCAWSPGGEYIIYYFSLEKLFCFSSLFSPKSFGMDVSNESAERHTYSVIDKNGILQDDIVEANGFVWNKTFDWTE